MTLESIAHSIIENGTTSQAPLLEALASLASDVAPGAAAALVDWSGAEVARLRAFDLVARAISRTIPEFDAEDLETIATEAA